MIVGFTGTRKGLSLNQFKKLEMILIDQRITEAHHGDCIGADAEFHDICLALKVPVVLHPPTNEKLRAFCKGAIREEKPLPYLARDIVIVDTCDLLLAAPFEYEEPAPQSGQGTWSTVRYARRSGRRSRIVWPERRMMMTTAQWLD